MEARLPVAKVVSVNPDSADIQDGLVVFGTCRVTGKEKPRSEGVLFMRSKYSKAVVRHRWNRRTVFADKQFKVETGGWFRPVLTPCYASCEGDKMSMMNTLFYCLRKPELSSSGNSELRKNQMRVTQ